MIDYFWLQLELDHKIEIHFLRVKNKIAKCVNEKNIQSFLMKIFFMNDRRFPLFCFFLSRSGRFSSLIHFFPSLHFYELYVCSCQMRNILFLIDLPVFLHQSFSFSLLLQLYLSFYFLLSLSLYRPVNLYKLQAIYNL